MNPKNEMVCFVILHYKDDRVTDACVKSILELEQQERIRIVLVDNDTDKPAAQRNLLKKRYEPYAGVHVLQIQENGGFSYANNKGYQYARRTWGNGFILVVNNDVVFLQKDFVNLLDAAYQADACHILAPDIIRRETGEHQNPLDVRLRTAREAAYTVRMNRLSLKLFPVCYPFLYFQLQKMRRAEQKRRAQKSFRQTGQEQIVPFGACLIYTPLFTGREEAAFEPETSFFYEEYLLALRCGRKQYRIVYDPSMRVLHENGSATKKSFRSEKKRIRFMLEKTAESAAVYQKELQKGTTKKERR